MNKKCNPQMLKKIVKKMKKMKRSLKMEKNLQNK